MSLGAADAGGRRTGVGSQDIAWILFGIASLAAAGGIAFACIRFGLTLRRLEKTLDGVDRQLADAEQPLTKTLVHVSGAAESIEDIVAKLDQVANAASAAAGAVAKTADAAQAAVTPTIANLVSVVAGVSEGAKKFFRSRGRNGSQDEA